MLDAHVHFWDAPLSWMTDELVALRRPFGPDDLRPLLQPNGVDQVVVVQASASSSRGPR
jgi:predicted TIM-barrel fold metal-dependent hydrolase